MTIKDQVLMNLQALACFSSTRLFCCCWYEWLTCWKWRL